MPEDFSSKYRRGSPYNPGQYPVADFMLGAGVDPANEVELPIKAIINSGLLSSGGSRMLEALRGMRSTKSPWAQDLVKALESPHTPESTSTAILEGLGTQRADQLTLNGDSVMTPLRHEKLAEQLAKTPLPEFSMSPVSGVKETKFGLPVKQFSSEEALANFPDAPAGSWEKGVGKNADARQAEASFNNTKNWSEEPSYRTTSGPPKDPSGASETISAVEGGKSPMSMALKSRAELKLAPKTPINPAANDAIGELLQHLDEYGTPGGSEAELGKYLNGTMTPASASSLDEILENFGVTKQQAAEHWSSHGWDEEGIK